MKEYRDDKGNLIWVTPGAVLNGVERTEWVLWYLDYLREGYYPQEPSSYIGGSHKKLARCPFEGAVLLSAEINRRLKRTGLDRLLVEEKYCKQLSESQIAQSLYMDEEVVYKRIRSAVSYIASGEVPRWINTEDRKGIDYREWVNNRRRQWLKHKVQIYR